MKFKVVQMALWSVLMVLVASCSPKLVPFTQQLRESHQLTAQELKSIQFYVSNTFVLRKGSDSTFKETQEGSLTVVRDSKVDEIVIKAGTPCVIREVIDGNRVTISMEDNGNKYLVFGSIGNNDGYYTLMAMDWNQGRGKINYGEKIYLSSRGSKDVFLAIRLKTLDSFKVNQQVIKGKTVAR